MRKLLGLALLLIALGARAQTDNLGRVALVQALKDAACGARLMCVAAHPDDEDGATLAYYRMKYGVKTFAVIATRGEGGQNEIGPELYNELAVIRTREMLAAAKVQGSEPHFLDLQEFGFSKSLEETFAKWGHDEALKRMLTVLRELHPDVVITHHGLMKDHGNHQAIGQIIYEAVNAAADPKYPFGPGVVVQALDVRKFEGDGEMNIPLGELEPMRGRTYAQIAARALEEHRSQGMKFFIDRYLSGSPVASYHTRNNVATLKCALKDMGWLSTSHPGRATNALTFGHEAASGKSVSPRERINEFWNDSDSPISISSIKICGQDSAAFSLVNPESFLEVPILRHGHLRIPIRLEQNEEGYYRAYMVIKLAEPSGVQTITKIEAYLYDADNDRDDISDSREDVIFPSGKSFDATKSDENNSGISDGIEDWDKDGISNRIEAFEGTDPFDPASTPEMSDGDDVRLLTIQNPSKLSSSPVMKDELGPLFENLQVNLRPASLRALARDAEAGLSNEGVLDALARISAEDRATAAEDLGLAGAIAAELRVQAKANDAIVVRGQALEITAQINDYGAVDVATLRATLTGTRSGFELISATQDVAVSEGVAEAKFSLSIPELAAFTMPHAERIFDGDVVFRPQLSVRIEGILGNGVPFVRTAEVYVDVAPPVTAAFDGGPYLLNPLRMQREATMALTLSNHAPGAGRTAVSLQVPVGWHASPSIAEVAFGEAEEERTINVNVIAVESFEGRETVRVALDGSPHTASTEVVSAAIALPKEALIGLVRSYDDTLERTMRRLGVAYALITADDFAKASLARFTSIVVDMRAYQYRPDLVANNAALFDYIREGGNVVVMYHKTFDWRPAYAPLPFNVANNRVTLEDAPMTLLVPEHPFFNRPNKITEADWQDWVQERGLYFAGDWAKEYAPLLGCADPGESPPPGALISTPYGKGHYTYCALALYRQLHALNPGALRLFANLLDH